MNSKAIRPIALLLCIITVMLCVSSCGSAKLTKSEEFAMTEAVNTLNSESKTNNYFLVSFEGFGIEPIVINKAIFKSGNLMLSWYGLVMILAVIVTLIYAFYLSKKEGVKTDDWFDIAIYGTIAALFGARFYYVATSTHKFEGKSFFKVFEIWDGGVEIFGAILGFAVAAFIVCKIKKINVVKVFDAFAPAAMLGQAIGRWGDFFNGTAYGYELRDGNLLYGLRMGIFPHLGTEFNIEAGTSSIAYVHPAFLYESVWNLIGFAIITVLFRKKKFDGQNICFYMAWYGLGRTFIELIKADSLYVLETIRISVLVGCMFFFIGVALIVYALNRGKKVRLAGEEYESTFPLFHTRSSNEGIDVSKEDDEINNNEGDSNNEAD